MVALALYLGQVLIADDSWQNPVNQAMVNQLLRDIDLDRGTLDPLAMPVNACRER
jgi:hypothetical protein